MRLLVFLILLFKISTANAPDYIEHWVIWNVGQGQWITEIENDTCTHFDFGGEVFAIKKINMAVTKSCQILVSQIHLAHNPLQSICCLFWTRNNWCNQVWNSFISREFNALGVDQD